MDSPCFCRWSPVSSLVGSGDTGFPGRSQSSRSKEAGREAAGLAPKQDARAPGDRGDVAGDGAADRPGLLLRTFSALHQRHDRFDAHNVLTMDTALTGSHYDRSSRHRPDDSAGARPDPGDPGVEAAAATSYIPLEGRLGLGFIIEGRPLTGGAGARRGRLELRDRSVLRGLQGSRVCAAAFSPNGTTQPRSR